MEVTFSGVVNVGGTGCLCVGMGLRVSGVVKGVDVAEVVVVLVMVAEDGVTGGWCCWCVGSLDCARGAALNGASGLGFGDCVDVDRQARKSVVDGVCSNGRARAFRKTERANILKMLY